ncbi:MAG: sigma-70 family RNA polymerase sigma factor [Verrucomicrobiaceae bacterium]|nr:sigma-70 family RNA polymerase sigma factor [Verrucomicrobiaceae bacterium]
MFSNPEFQPLFPVTAWTLVRRVQTGEAVPSAQAALESLCATYWEPVRRYLKALGCREDETADVTQEFFASFLRNGGFERANPELSKLRTFIKLAAHNFLLNHWRNRMSQRRGGGASPENLDEVPEIAEAERSLAEQAYDREWAQAVLDRALKSVQEGYAKRGRAEAFEAIKAGLLRPGGLSNTSEVAVQLGVPEAQVRVAVHRARQRLADALRDEVLATVESPAEVEAEVRYLIGVIAHTQ